MADQQLDVTRKSFKTSYRKHYAMYKEMLQYAESDQTRRMTLFYSVECGLKCRLMQDIGVDKYSELKQYCDNNQKKNLAGHDLRELIKATIPNNRYRLDVIRLEKGNKKVSPLRFHELWRYGAIVYDEKENENAERVLVKVAEWLENKL